ncbi:putative Mg2+ transporter-C (MgtC) family protein [Nocardiopsis mwathae]|uniref:Putative Mg2+ transporter-C (MgtC) family protein n=1 Tax=Nocardiopsis mwathae TaxID=1472723 RepID=A0A7W9YHK1_9ACTN|nr:MgtC/SapB family protein [Nocardiopsis mwathae]MBB6172272.1 putative Mg2+ transporter-C (MgtC) family protein [Nocardiopsis mwathae]
MQDLSVQGWEQLAALLLALVLCSLIGLERQFRQKSAGLRTHTLVGLGAALFIVVGKYGFGDVLTRPDVVLDPSRVAAQIVSGVGFIGAGLVFVRRDIVRGLTTAAAVWLSAAVGTAAGAGLWVVAIAVTTAYFVVAFCYPWILRWGAQAQPATSLIHVGYEGGRGVLRSIVTQATRSGFVIQAVRSQRAEDGRPGPAVIDLVMRVQGKGDVNELAADLWETPGVHRIDVGPDEEDVQE